MQPRAQFEHNLVEQLGVRLRQYFPKGSIDHPGLWVSYLFSNLRKAIRGGDKIAVSIACELIDQDPMLPIGKLIKSGLARELRRNVANLIGRQVFPVHGRLSLAMVVARKGLQDRSLKAIV
jgi:hypothetical protein